jgi:putative phage-type endonuclease
MGLPCTEGRRMRRGPAVVGGVAMTAALVPSPPQTRAEGGIGASEAAAAIGVNPYQTPLDLWLVKTGRAAPFAGNEATFFGQVLEPVVRAHYVETNQVLVHVPPTSLWHRSIPWLKATPDGIVVDEQGLWRFVAPQVKCVGFRQAQRWEDDIPEEYVIQAVVEMAVTDLDRLDFAVLVGGSHYVQPTVHRDRELEALVLQQLAEFQQLIESDTQPAIDGSSSFRKWAHAQIKRKQVIQASPEAVSKMERLREVVVLQAQLEREEKVLKNELLAELAAANGNTLVTPIGNLTLGAPRRKTAWKSVATSLKALTATMRQTALELDALRADIADDLGSHAPALQRIEAMRAQLRLMNGTLSYEDLVASNTQVGEPPINRPRAWTKDHGGFDHEED